MRHRRMVAPINSIKHYVSQTNDNLAANTIRNQVLVDAVGVASAGANSFDVEEGAIVKAIHLDFWVSNKGATGTNIQFNSILEKVPSNQTAATTANLLNLGSYPNKKNILYSFQGNLQAAVDGVATLPHARGWQLIPKGKQRFGLGDRLILSLASVGQIVNICGLATYKEYK